MRLFLVLVLLIPLLMAGALYGLFLIWGEDLPAPRTPREVEPSINTVLLDRNGEVIDELFVENRSLVWLQEIPEVMCKAVLATEDRRFYRHWGIDLLAVFRALSSNLAAGGIQQGGSTITQQLARNLFLSQSQTLQRKVKEAILAVRLERSFSKDEIMELYLNQIYFGDGAYGVEAAAGRFFGKSCRDLSLEEAALLAGLPANPSLFSPVRHPEAARQRRNLVLRRMEQAGMIDRGTREGAEASEVKLASRLPARSRSRAPYFSEMIRQELVERYGSKEVFHGGLTVYTTLDLRLQEVAQTALEAQLEKIEEKHTMSYHYLRAPETRMGTLGERKTTTPYLQGAMVALEPQTGAIRALIGGRNFAESNFNRATQALRQPGSAFKPFIYATALRDGHRTTDILMDSPVSYSRGGPEGAGGVWSPQNFHHDYRGPVTLRYALMKSINVPSVRLLEMIGPRRVIELAQAMGVERKLPPYLSLALGTGEITPLEITAAYAVFPNQGIWRQPYIIEKVEDRHGRVLESHQPRSREVLDDKTAFLMVSMMRSVLEGGTAWSARAVDGFLAPSGGKTGTTDDYSDAWFVGFIPRLACGVWVGFDEKKTIGSRMTGAAAALPPWSALMKEAVTIYGEEDFVAPPGIVFRSTCLTSGLLATPSCPRAVLDAFRIGTDPNRQCHVHLGLLPGGEDPTEHEDE